MRRIAVLNQKGGVGKTTTVVNLGACLAELGHRALLVDMDPQANMSMHLGLEAKGREPSVYTFLRGEDGPSDVVRATALEGLHAIAAHIDLAGLEVELSDMPGSRETRLRDALAGLADGFDYMLVDCPPSLGLLTLNVMCAVDELFIPLQTEFFALQGLGRLTSTVELVRSRLNPALEITGIIACMFDVRTSLATEVLQDIRTHFGDRVFATVIRKNVRLAEAPSFGLPITAYDRRCYGTEDYRSLAREVLAMAGVRAPAAVEDDAAPPLPGAEATEATAPGEADGHQDSTQEEPPLGAESTAQPECPVRAAAMEAATQVTQTPSPQAAAHADGQTAREAPASPSGGETDGQWPWLARTT
jgi:chromosome partitioning protein